MNRQLPPLNALRAFEATARHLSFSKAALELNVTPAALSHQIAGLEKRLGVKLFERKVRGIELTDSGRLIYPGIHAAFEAMLAALQPLDASQHDKTLVISATPGFAVKWLVPRLHRFLEKHADIDTRISGSLQASTFTDGVDAAVRYVISELPKGTFGQPLARDTVVPLCSPHLRTGANPLRAIDAAVGGAGVALGYKVLALNV